MNDDQVRTIAERVLAGAFARYGFERAEVLSRVDSSDEPALYISAVFAEHAPELESEVLLRAHAELSRALLDEGEERFPYLRTRHLGDELPEDDKSGDAERDA